MRYIVVLVLTTLVAFGCGTRRPPAAPESAPHVDGKLDPQEWRGARIAVLPDSTSVHLLRAEGHLYVGLDLVQPGVGSLCLLQGDVVTVLHASAALGTARYRRVGEEWQLVQPFTYTLRETDDSEASRARRAEYLAEHGWVASTAGMGGADGTLEYLIRLDLTGGAPHLRVAALALTASPEVSVWPRGREDDCGNLALVRGETPERLRFDPADWLPLAPR